VMLKFFLLVTFVTLSQSVDERCRKFFNPEVVGAVSEAALDNFCANLGPLNLNTTSKSVSGELGPRKPSNSEVWGYGLLMVTLISLTSVLGVSVLPLMSKSFYSSLLTCLIGLAVGSLAGSSVFHLIPSAFRLSESRLFPHHSYLSVSLAIWGGLYLFFLIERALKIVMDAKARKKGEHGLEHKHSHHHDFGQPLRVSNGCIILEKDGEKQIRSPDSLTTVQSPLMETGDLEERGDKNANCVDAEEIYQNSQSAIKASFGHQNRPHPVTRPTVEGVRSLESKTSSSGHVQTVAWMIIFGDGIHNFIDGLSIGAAFSESILTGISVSVAVLAEEFPHELGDFAVLLNAGMSMKQALIYNFLSACTCYLGLVLGILLGELDANSYIFGLAGGMFLYISLVDMVPELNESVEEASKSSVSKAVRIFALQNLGILLGIGCLFTLAKFQDDIQIG